MRILVLEHLEAPARAFVNQLRSEGYAVDVAQNLVKAREMRSEVDYDALILDRDAPGGDALDMVVDLRADKDTVPITLMSADADGEERTWALQTGADEYMNTPVDPRELSLRLRKLIIRTLSRRPVRTRPVLVVGRVTLSRDLHRVYLDDEVIKLSASQFCLMELFMTKRHRPISVREILAHCWDMNLASNQRPLPPQLTRLRQAFGEALLVESVEGGLYQVWIDGDEESEWPTDADGNPRVSDWTRAEKGAKATKATRAPSKATRATKAPSKATKATKAPSKATRAPSKAVRATRAPSKATKATKAPSKAKSKKQAGSGAEGGDEPEKGGG